MPDRKELGLSSQDYEDAINLEKVYALINANPKCSECRKRKTGYVDLNRIQLVCETCGRKRENCKPAGAERISSSDIKKFERRYKRGGSTTSKSMIKESKRDRGNRSRRAPSVTSSSPSDASSDSETPPPSTRRYNQSSHTRRRATRPDDDNIFGEATSTPGMRNLVMGQPQMYAQQQQAFTQPASPQFSSQYPTRFPASYSPGPFPSYNAPMGQKPPYTPMQPNIPPMTTTPGYPTMQNTFQSTPNYQGYGGQSQLPYTSQLPPTPTLGFNTNTIRPNNLYMGMAPVNNYPANSPFRTGQSPAPTYPRPNQPYPTNQLGNFPTHMQTPAPFNTAQTPPKNPFAPQNMTSSINNRFPISGQQFYNTPYAGSTFNYNPYSMY